jgi:hypothetical protein
MTTLRIEHPIVDFDLWRKAFDSFADTRARAGVLSHRILRPVDDDRYVAIDLDFPTPEAAQEFLDFLRAKVWASPQASPALAGAPKTRILRPAG